MIFPERVEPFLNTRMTNRQTYRYLIAALIFIVPYQLILGFGPASEKGAVFEGLWQVWHPYYLPAVGLITIPIIFGYNMQLAKRLGGRSSAFGRMIFWMSLGMFSFTVVGAMIVFGYLTCSAWPVLACDNQLGWTPYPSWAHVFFLLMYPLVILGMRGVFSMLAITRRDVIRNLWILGIVVGVSMAIALPAGLGFAFESMTWTWPHVVDLAILLCGSLVLWTAIVAALHARDMSGGLFFRPLLVFISGFAFVALGDLIAVHTNIAGRYFEPNDPSAVPYTLGFVLWVAAFLKIGTVLERMTGLEPAPTDTPEAQAT